jgi:hypothetical protein
MSDAIMDTNVESTDAPQNSQASAKTYTQEEFDRHMAGMRKSIESKFEKQFAELGDLNELKQLKATAEKTRQDEALKRGEFETILKEMAQKKDAEIAKRDAVIREYRVDTPLLNAASKYRSVNPEQVRALLKNNITLGEDGITIVTDEVGKPRYKDDGTAYAVDDLVQDFLSKNPHFVQPTLATTASKSSISSDKAEGVNIAELDMSNPEHRKRYAQAKSQGTLKA